jgi:hypothetical protein
MSIHDCFQYELFPLTQFLMAIFTAIFAAFFHISTLPFCGIFVDFSTQRGQVLTDANNVPLFGGFVKPFFEFSP